MIVFYLSMGVWGIVRMSVTFDELAHLSGGYTYIAERDYRINSQDHPPLAKIIAAVPLLFLNPQTFTYHPFWKSGAQWSYGDLFLFHNRVSHDMLLRAGRISLLGLSVLLGILIFIWAKELGGNTAGLIGAGLFYMFPGFIANGGLVATDVPLSLCYFFAAYCFWKLYTFATLKQSIILGVSIGLTLGVKFSGILLFPSLVLLSCWWFYARRKINIKRALIYTAAAGITAFFVIALLYQFVHLDWYIRGFKNIFRHVKGGRGSFLLGEHSIAGWWYYFPVTFLLKTPAGILFLVCMSLGILPIIIKTGSHKDALLFLSVPVIVYMASSMLSPMQIGHRHILPVYPFIFTWIGWSCVQLKNKIACLSVMGIGAAFLSVVWAQPYNLEYFNIFIGSKNNAYKYLVDSNLDWGQGLKELGRYLRASGKTDIFLSFFGNADPHHEGIRYVPVLYYSTAKRTGDDPEDFNYERVLFAVSATQRQCVYYTDKSIFKWLDELTPVKTIAYSIFVYDLTGNRKALTSLKNLLERTGQIKAGIKIGELISRV